MLLLPAFVYTGALMTENAAFPLFTLAMFAIAVALERPTLWTQAFALAAVLLAAGVRTQAVALAGDPQALERLREHLRGPGRTSALFDTERTTRALEAAYLAMADQYRRGVREPIEVD